MTRYHAIVSIDFDDKELQEFAEGLGLEGINPEEGLDGMLSNLAFGEGWVEQIFQDGLPTMVRSMKGIMVEVDEHEK